ncbi:hypothetical protein [Cytobacillus oceanisediminis]|uniref:hypothetical protein n=1 Tax=Cytobacillus oceanisediminis TaxID=665099 RepID=UPI001C237597|nr:hypothetical protein [Cytobacillus oceanisediminis]MBU8772101.1 hypothetical protein [Cytobacillus oceanisediminis]
MLSVSDLISFIQSEFLLDNDSLDVEEDLIRTGILDSFGMMKVAFFIESKIGRDIDVRDIHLENFQTVYKIYHLIKKKYSEN